MKLTTKIWNNFITGIAVLLPAAITILILSFLATKLNQLFLEPTVNFFKPYLANHYIEALLKVFAFFVILSFVVLVGMAARIIVLRKLFGFGEGLVIKVPLIGRIYNATKQMSRAFLGKGKSMFKKVVLMEYPRKGVWSIGFITGEMRGEIEEKIKKELLSIFVPTTPNPTSGIYLVVPKSEAIVLDMSVEEGFKLVISGGTVIP